MNKIIGIDLGTTFSAVSVMEGGVPKIIPNTEGHNTTPSVVSVSSEEVVVGEVAKRGAALNPKGTIRSIKRLMGTKKMTNVNGKDYSPEEVSAMVLKKLKKDAEAYLGHEVTDAVITVPAYFGDAQRNATKDAGVVAGLNVKRIVNEPTAAALAYGLNKEEDHTILVFDFGGGTFDVSILELGGGMFEVKSTSGDNYLGGDDIDDAIITYLIEEFKKENKYDLKKDIVAMQKLKEAAENAKIELSSSDETKVAIPYIITAEDGPKHLDVTLTKVKFEEICREIFEKLKAPIRQAIKDAKNPKLDKIILVGGSTRIPKVRELVEEITGMAPDHSVNPDEAVSLGAVIQGAIISGEVKDVLLLDVTSLTLGIETQGGLRSTLIERNTTIPTRKSDIFVTTDDGQTSVTINVLQGEREFAADNQSLGEFVLDGLLPAPRGHAKVEVAFDIDTDGIVSVSAKDLATGKEQKITVTGGSLTEEEIQKMINDSKSHKAEDEEKRDLILAENEAMAIIQSTANMMEEYKDKVDPLILGNVEVEMKNLIKAMNSKNTKKIVKGIDSFKEAGEQIGISIYANAEEAAAAQAKA
ncbi:molecular chaperone DnaK [Candidatus Pacearchaeota archaeon]|nr:molecular chaperone DnaK [Candidatus Pacearchaeota archaeon]